LEQRKDCEFITIVHQIKISYVFQLNNKYLRKFSLRTRLSARLFTIIWKIGLILTFTIPLIFSTIAYFDSEIDFSIIVISIWLMILIISLHYAASILLIANIYMYNLSVYIKYRFQQIQDYIEIYLRRGKYLINKN